MEYEWNNSSFLPLLPDKRGGKGEDKKLHSVYLVLDMADRLIWRISRRGDSELELLSL